MAQASTKQTDIFGNSSAAYPTVAGGLKFSGASILAFKSVIQDYNGNFSQSGSTTDDSATLQGSFVGMIIQNYQLQYQQNITKLRGLNNNWVFNVVAPPSGQITLATALVDDTDYYAFCKQYGDACYTRNNYMYIAPPSKACGEADLIAQFKKAPGSTSEALLPQLALKGCLISQLQIAQNVQDLVMTSNLMIEFVALNSKDQVLTEDGATYTLSATGEVSEAQGTGTGGSFIGDVNTPNTGTQLA